MRAIRWSDNDKYFGPFTYCGSNYRRMALVLGSGCDEHLRCRLRMQVGRKTLIIALPAVIRPWRQWIDTSHYEWSKGNGGYWDVHERVLLFRRLPAGVPGTADTRQQDHEELE